MAYVRNFQHDVFISYARADNEADKWVDNLKSNCNAPLNSG